MSLKTTDTRAEGVDATADESPLVLYDRVKLDEDGNYAAVITFNRAESLNAMDWPTLRVLEVEVRKASEDADVRAVLITGKGRAFSAGGDIKGYVKLQADPIAFPRFVDDFIRILDSLHYMEKPVVALVNGITAAGGLELLLACDFAWMAESARIGDMHLNYAQIGGAGVMARLPQLIGPNRARELVFSGKLLSSQECLAWGLVNRVFPDDQLLAEGIEFARGVAAKSPNSVRNVKHVINRGLETDLPAALRQERERALIHCLTLPDSMEGINAFVEKRKPRWPKAQ
jgi:enoyl-CoA hydratase/carnithine racemase